ncbi:MAG: GDP-mannose 4,6-dehydratase [Candidatus Thermoplasmatota archaeon]|nr:GDP-mannose 4,6-dehydratase [Candidatus Thermoplasmatota archaeon]
MKVLITGISGQDGFFLSKLLFEKGYEIQGVIRRNSSMSQGTVSLLPEEIRKNVVIHYGDLTDANFFAKLLRNEKPEELYHLAAQSFVGYSFQNPSSTYDVNISGTLNIVNAIKDYSPNTRMYFAATSEMFGQPETTPQNEDTPLKPRSPYAISKLAGYWTTRNYREAYDLFMSNGILFNHESEVRGPEFVTRKISLGVARIANGSEQPIELGNLDSRKDWGYAEDYVTGMWKMLQNDKPCDYVLGTGVLHTVREFAQEAFKVAGIRITWKGKGVDEVGISDDGKVLVRVNEKYFRPLESDNYRADFSRAKRELGWKPTTYFEKLVEIMVKNDLKNIQESLS